MKISDKYRNWFESDKLVADIMIEAANDIDERDAEIERLREALKYYADVKNWKLILESNKNYSVEIDGGQIARSALQQKESE